MKKKKLITRQEVDFIIKNFRGSIKIGPYVIHENSVTVYGDVRLCHSNSYKLPLKFGHVYGDFIVSSNKLTTLKGCPTYVAGDFNCYGNNLTSLKYAPEVDGSFYCHENKLTSLKGAPKIIPGNFSCFLNVLTSFVDGPAYVNGNFYGNNNELITLEGSPEYVQSFHVGSNYINNLVGCPKEINGIFSFDNTVSLYMGNQDCKVKRIEFQSQVRVPKSEKVLPEIVINYKKFLPIVFSYMHLLDDIFSLDGRIDESHFMDLILDIKDGFR